MNELISDLYQKEKELKRKKQILEKELEECDAMSKCIFVKEIQGKKYYYEQWYSDGKKVNRSLGRVSPGAVAENELLIEKKKSLEKELSKTRILTDLLVDLRQKYEAKTKDSLLTEYSFEVFWKDDLTARVSVRDNKVKIAKYSNHPARQIFGANNISRDKLNNILALRFFEKERADYLDKVNSLNAKSSSIVDIIRKTHGVSYNDYIWFRFPGESISSKDVLVRK